MKIFKLLIFLSFSNLIFAQIKIPNLANYYNPSSTSIHPNFKIYNLNDSVIRVFFVVNLDELEFQETDDYKLAKLKFQYVIFSSLSKREVIDSASKIFIIKRRTPTTNNLTTYFDIKTNEKKLFLAVILSDLIGKSSNSQYFKIDRSSVSENDFLLRADDRIVFKNFSIKSSDNLFLSTSLNLDSVFLVRYDIDSTFPTPPFSSSQKINFLKKLEVRKIPINKSFRIEKKGYYVFTADTDTIVGLRLLYINDYFPKYSFASDMLRALVYITTTNEFKEINSYPNKKLSLDNFWLKIANNDISLAKDLIKIYYYRVYLANYYFSSFKPGAYTDRGMIYIVLGPPHFVYIYDNKEVWLYIVNSTNERVFFEFYENNNNFVLKDYFLLHRTGFLNVWQLAVSYWKKGKLYIY